MSKGERLPSMFSTTDEQFHANLRRCVNSAFSMSSLVQYEPFVDRTTEVFLDQTQRHFASENAVCDFAQWLQFYAFDVIGEMTYSKRHGFVDRVEDVDGMVSYLGKLFSYVAPVCISSLANTKSLLTVLVDRPDAVAGPADTQESYPSTSGQARYYEFYFPRRYVCEEAYERTPRRNAAAKGEGERGRHLY